MSKNKSKSFEAKKDILYLQFFFVQWLIFFIFIFYFFDEKNDDETNEQQILAPSDLRRRHDILQDDTELNGILPMDS